MSDKPTPSSHGEVLRMVTDVIASYLKKNPVAASDLPGVIATVYGAFSAPQSGTVEPVVERPEPAVPIKRSVTPDFIICLEDGKQLKMLKRHLATSYNLTPDEYRARWGLPADYPMVAPNYATQRSALAKQIGLGSRARDGKPVRKAKTV
ncbi:MAG TPA: MucR family transcriptional regulator [Aliidongia sp.]|uniref:MucR family transcriptional regulator n=1 Tax=Aliidongia sp. TaxID=1914230 RepID=UPI002DDCC422|nr:MucR family transcriptional regulator [Aliidongia sp.]HEV2678153.1 MucR family transcriptional regulator [Aliidongia sp.]